MTGLFIAESADPRVPYSNRMILTAKGGTALVWPFIDCGPRLGPLELVLDNNAFTNPRWLAEIGDELKGRHLTINPWFAVVEQWLSNEEFRKDPVNRTKDFLSRFEAQRVLFSVDSPEIWSDRLKRNDAQLRYQLAVTFGYIAIMKKLVDWKRGTDEPLSLLIELSRTDVPRFGACLLLSCVILFLKEKQSLRLAGDKATAMSYIDSFFAYQPKEKNEPNYLTRQYLRNRAGDLLIWYALPLLYEKGMRWAGDPVLVTKDKALYRLIFRMVPPALGFNGGQSMQFSPAYNEIPDDWQELHAFVKQMNFGFTPPSDNNQKLVRLKNLFDFAKRHATGDEKGELEAAWIEWVTPGFGKEFHH